MPDKDLILSNKNISNQELLNEDFDVKIPNKIFKNVIDSFPDTSFARIYNTKMFEAYNFLIKINKEWFLWDDENQKLEDWNWERDINAIQKDSDIDEIEEFMEGWEIVSTNILDRGGEEYFEELVNKMNPQNIEFIPKEFFQTIENENLSAEEFIKSAIKKYNGSEESLNDAFKTIMKKMKI